MLLKVHSRCNLACDHCYIYEHADQSWRGRPLVMSPAVVEQTAARIAEHVIKHNLPFVIVILHGGEPLLAGVEALDHAARTIRQALAGHAKVALGVQTNGILLDDRFLELFFRHRIRIGISLDGPAAANDRHRKYADGRGSHAATIRALRRLQEPRYRDLYGGILCTVDLANDPIEVFEHLSGFEPPEIDFLLPHGTWTRPPPGRHPDDPATPYADWLIPIFDSWYDDEVQEIRIRFFESLISLLLGGPSGSESIGLAPVDLITVETDGTIEQGDVLKITAPGAPATGLHVTWNSFDEYLEHPGVQARQSGLAGLSDTCRRCSIVQVCGGGLYAHRYQAENGFDNPSIYCADLAKLVRHVAGRLATDLPPAR
ncbi:FxsB family radical SAM/SPASM domain protein [Actinoplanes sp. NBC_00393]|uniref:FxsB family cyclophane-forming radical SAM/SPASM peptide maturase n=1 Tax=Actinoplanes sp. NBC_00393 TaxID=2975953 RepID=UPI002E1ECDB9